VVPPPEADTWRHVPWETQEEGLGFALLLTNHSRGCVLNSQNLVIEYQRSTHTPPAQHSHLVATSTYSPPLTSSFFYYYFVFFNFIFYFFLCTQTKVLSSAWRGR